MSNIGNKNVPITICLITTWLLSQSDNSQRILPLNLQFHNQLSSLIHHLHLLLRHEPLLNHLFLKVKPCEMVVVMLPAHEATHPAICVSLSASTSNSPSSPENSSIRSMEVSGFW
ncbi:hypothetical protein Lal_00025555 [Lupinus albus]|nr:hypothetical protein Lal_00025555 [Lupinus albus]